MESCVVKLSFAHRQNLSWEGSL